MLRQSGAHYSQKQKQEEPCESLHCNRQQSLTVGHLALEEEDFQFLGSVTGPVRTSSMECRCFIQTKDEPQILFREIDCPDGGSIHTTTVTARGFARRMQGKKRCSR